GKELVARAIHYRGLLSKRPFVAVDCGSLVPTLIESELFGYEKGAFTGALRSKEGLFQSANGGTIFLDEIGELSQELQAKLLRVLQEKEVRPVGSNQKIKVDVRVIAATNRDLEAAQKEGKFRKDLYFRLNVVTVHLPPLRERRWEFHQKPCGACCNMTGQATCVSWKIALSARSPWAARMCWSWLIFLRQYARSRNLQR